MAEDEDLLWAGKLSAIRTPGVYADPAKPEVFMVTRLLLEAGHQLREEELARGHGGATHGMSRVTRDRVVRRALALRDERQVRLGSKITSFTGAFNDRWSSVDAYRKDVVVFDLYWLRWREALEQSRRLMLELLTDIETGRLSGSDFIRAVVHNDAQVRATYMRYSLSEAALAIEPAYRELAVKAHAEFVTMHVPEWVAAYESIQQRFGIVLRPEVSLDKAFRWIAWLVQAAAWEGNVTETDTTELAVEGILALITGLADPGDARSPAAVVSILLSDRTTLLGGDPAR